MASLFIATGQYTGIFLALFFFLFCFMIINCFPLYDKIIFQPLAQLITFKSYKFLFCCNKTIELNIGHIQQVLINRSSKSSFDMIFVLLDGKESKVINNQNKNDEIVIKLLKFLNTILPVNVIFIHNLYRRTMKVDRQKLNNNTQNNNLNYYNENNATPNIQ